MKSRTTTRTLKNPEKYAPLLAIRNGREYDAAVAQLNDLVDEVGGKDVFFKSDQCHGDPWRRRARGPGSLGGNDRPFSSMSATFSA